MESKSFRKFIAIITIGLFLSLVGHTTLPEGVEKTSDHKAKYTADVSDTGGGVIEQEGTDSRKKKKFPWLLVVGGAVVVGIVLYLLLKKSSPKEYKLTVSLGNGVTGTPAGGTHKYDEDTVVNYNYSLGSGYKDLKVTLDSQAAGANGSVVMNKDHTLSASATKEDGTSPEPQMATVNVNSSPTGAAIIMDGEATGHTTNHTYTFNVAGSHNVILQKVGYKEFSGKVNAVLGSTNTLSAALQAGLNEQFNNGAENTPFWLWQSGPNTNWYVSGGEYICETFREWLPFNTIYGHKFTQDRNTVTVKMMRSRGVKGSSNGLILTASPDTTSVNGYLFQYFADGVVSVWRFHRYNLDTDRGGWAVPIHFHRLNPAVNKGLNVWNVLKVVRDGNNYTFYVNNKLITSFSDAKFDPSYLVLMGYSAWSMRTLVHFDYVKIEIGQTAGSVIGSPVDESRVKIGKNQKNNPFFYKEK